MNVNEKHGVFITSAIELIMDPYNSGSVDSEEPVDNDTFMFHPFCWCESAECPWCRSCECDYDAEEPHCVNCVTYPGDSWYRRTAPNFWYKPSGGKVWWYKRLGRSMEFEGEFPLNFVERCLASQGVE